MKRNLELLERADGFNKEVIKTYEIGKNYIYTYSKHEDDFGYLEVQHTGSKEKILKVIFDGYKMIWYGSYRVFAFDCTWKPDILSLPYENPSYLFEKLAGGIKGRIFEDKYAREAILKYIKEGTWFEYDLNEEQRKNLISWMEEGAKTYDFPEDLETDYEDLLELISKIWEASGDEYEWVETIRSLDEDDCYTLFGLEPYSMFDWGSIIHPVFYFLLYVLSLVAEDYSKKVEKQ